MSYDCYDDVLGYVRGCVRGYVRECVRDGDEQGTERSEEYSTPGTYCTDADKSNPSSLATNLLSAASTELN